MRAMIAFASAALLASTAGAAAPSARPASLVLLHGKIHTQDPRRRVAQAMALRGQLIVAVGSDRNIAPWIGPQTRIVDLDGRVVLPGLIDAHTHPAESAQDSGKCSLEDVKLTPRQAARRIAVCLGRRLGSAKQWLEVVQVNPSGLTLSRTDLDAMVPGRPLILSGSDGHTAWLNTAALKAARITAATRDPPGGTIIRTAQGGPQGTLRDNAILLALAAKPAPSLENQASQLDRAFDAMRAIGITSIQDAAVDDHDMQLYKRLYDQHRLKMRVRGCLWLKNLQEPARALIGGAARFRAKWSIDPQFLRADCVKIFTDGVIEYPSQTAALLQPYLGADGRPTTYRGPAYFAQDNLDRIVAAADEAGLTVHVHAIGDRATRSALDAFAYSRRRNGVFGNRDQIAHLELVDPADFPRFKTLAVIANFQLLWAERDDYIEQATLPYIGPTRSRYLYPARSLRDAGALIAGGSDWDVSSFNPFEAMEHAITRSQRRGREPLLPEQSLDIQDIVDAYTINAAYALRQERTTGSLEPGKRGDFVVLEDDIFAMDPFDLHTTRVSMTYLDGQEVYAAAPHRLTAGGDRVALIWHGSRPSGER